MNMPPVDEALNNLYVEATLSGLSDELCEGRDASDVIVFALNYLATNITDAFEKREPDEWGWHWSGCEDRFDGYVSEIEAKAAMYAFMDGRDGNTVGPYPIYDGEAKEDYRDDYDDEGPLTEQYENESRLGDGDWDNYIPGGDY